MQEKFQENLRDAIKNIQIADHITYVTLPLVNEKRLLLKVFDEIYKSIMNCIKAVLNYEFEYRKIKIYKNDEENLNLFFERYSGDYGITTEQVRKIKDIIELKERYKKSAMEFVKKDKVVLLSDSLRTNSLDIPKIKEYLLLGKEILMKVSSKINRKNFQF